jgi:hypothetical protein
MECARLETKEYVLWAENSMGMSSTRWSSRARYFTNCFIKYK